MITMLLSDNYTLLTGLETRATVHPYFVPTAIFSYLSEVLKIDS